MNVRVENAVIHREGTGRTLGLSLEHNSLLSDSRLLNQFLAKNYPLIAPLEALFNNSSRLSDDSAGHHKTLVVEVGH